MANRKIKKFKSIKYWCKHFFLMFYVYSSTTYYIVSYTIYVHNRFTSRILKLEIITSNIAKILRIYVLCTPISGYWTSKYGSFKNRAHQLGNFFIYTIIRLAVTWNPDFQRRKYKIFKILYKIPNMKIVHSNIFVHFTTLWMMK